MDNNPRSYRVPVLRLSDISQDAGISDEKVQDDSFDFQKPQQSEPHREPGVTFLDGGNGALQNETGPIAEPSPPTPPPRDTTSSAVPVMPEQVFSLEAQPLHVAEPVVPQKPAPTSSSDVPRAPLSKIIDPFERPKTIDPLDIWEQAAVKKMTPLAPKPTVPHSVPPIAPPQTQPQVREDLEPNLVPTSPYTYGAGLPEKDYEVPRNDVETPVLSSDATADLLNQTLRGMDFSGPVEESSSSAASISKQNAIHMDIQAVADPLEEIGIPQTEQRPVPTPPSPPTSSHQSPLAGGNLAALRERVLHSGTAHAGSEQSNTPEGAAQERSRAPTNQSPTRDAHDMVHNAFASLNMPPTPETAPDTKRIPETEHAKVIAGVAKALHDIQQNTGETPRRSPEPVILSEAIPGFKQETAPYVPTSPTRTPEGISTPHRTGIPMIRTFKSDMEKTINKDRVSVVKMISDQETQRQSGLDTVVRRTSLKHFTIGSFFLVVGIVVFLAGAIALGVFVSVVTLRPSVTDTVNTLFFADQSIEHSVTGQDRTTLLQGLTRVRDGLTAGFGKVTEVVPVEDVVVEGVDTKQTRSITGKEFLKRVNARAPEAMQRTVQDSFIVGFHNQTTQEPFIVFRVGSHESAFSGMLQWEETMDADLAPLFGTPVFHAPTPIIQPPQHNEASTTGTTTDDIEPDPITVDVRDLGVFDDISIANIPARALRNNDGNIQLIWAMPDTSTIIITTNTETLREIRTRMQAR